jgi:hypothetical protein
MQSRLKAGTLMCARCACKGVETYHCQVCVAVQNCVPQINDSLQAQKNTTC